MMSSSQKHPAAAQQAYNPQLHPAVVQQQPFNPRASASVATSSATLHQAQNVPLQSQITLPSEVGDRDTRDPNDMNGYLKVTWDNVIAEPDGIRSTDCAWDCSYTCFQCTSRCCYILLTTLLAPIMAFLCALNFAMVSFEHIWCYIPCLRIWKIQMHCIYSFITLTLKSTCGPCCETLGLCLSKMKVRYMKVDHVEEEVKDIRLIV